MTWGIVADILILSGPPASGKSSVARALADRYDRVAHVQVDGLRHMITATGYVHPGARGDAWLRQWALSVRNACGLTANFVAERFAVIIDDVVMDAGALNAYAEGLKPIGVPVHYVRLMPRLEVCLARNAGREGDRVQPERVEAVWREFVAAGEHAGVTIDSSDLSVEATADRLQALTTSGQSIIWSPEG